MTCRLITALVVLACWGGPGVHSILAQSRPSPSEFFRELQSEQTTDRARDELLRFGKKSTELGRVLADKFSEALAQSSVEFTVADRQQAAAILGKKGLSLEIVNSIDIGT